MKIKIVNKTEYRSDDIRRLFKECIRRDGVHRRMWYLVIEHQRFNGRYTGLATYNGSWIKLLLRNPNNWGGELSDPKRVASTIFHELKHSKGMRDHKEFLDNEDIGWVDGKFPLRLREDVMRVPDEEIKAKIKPLEEQYKQLVDKYQYWNKEYNEGNKSPETNQLWQIWKEKEKMRKRIERIKNTKYKVKPKPKPNLIQKRYNHAQKKVKEMQTKKKRTETLLKKWNKKCKYYEGKLQI